MRWIFHIARSSELGFGATGRYAPLSLEREGFIHGSYHRSVRESAQLYFRPDELPSLKVLAIDPRRLDVPVEVADTPRGPMPHIQGSIPSDAVEVLDLHSFEAHPDVVRGSRIALVAFEGMTLLDLVGPLDALSRLETMQIDATSSCEVVAMTCAGATHLRPAERARPLVWAACGAELTATQFRPSLGRYDVLVVPGGPGTCALEHDADAIAWVASFPANRLTASVCTGSLLLGAAGRLSGRRATTHHTMLAELARFGAIASRERVVDEGQLVTAGGVTAGIDLGLHLVERLAGREAYAAIAAQMEVVRS